MLAELNLQTFGDPWVLIQESGYLGFIIFLLAFGIQGQVSHVDILLYNYCEQMFYTDNL